MLSSQVEAFGKPRISGRTRVIAHLGYPTETFTAPLIYNPWFEQQGIDAVVVPMGVKAADYPGVLRSLARLTNLHGALVTMPHKRTTVALLDECSAAVRIAGACNAILLRADGTLLGDMFDGEGFVRGLARKGFRVAGANALVVGAGGVGSAIVASLAAAGIGAIVLADVDADATAGLRERLARHYPHLPVHTGSSDPAGYDLVVNATPLGMDANDTPPFDFARLAARTFVGEVVLKDTPLLHAARAKGCGWLAGTDMLFEQIPAYLEFFGFGTAKPEALRAAARLQV